MSSTLPRPSLISLPVHFPAPTKRRPRKTPTFSVHCSAGPTGPNGFSWSGLPRSLLTGSGRFLSKLGESAKKEAGVDLDNVLAKMGEFVEQVKGGVERGRTEAWPVFVDWNRWERWKDLRNWEAQRVGALVIYVSAVVFSCHRLYVAVRDPRVGREKMELTETYMEALVPEPSPRNIRKFKKGLWRKSMPKGLIMKKFVEGPDGTLIRDTSYVGEDAWNDDPEPPRVKVNQIIEKDDMLNTEEKRDLKRDLQISDEHQGSKSTWRERLNIWKEILRNEKVAEQLESANAKYAVEFDMKEVEKSLMKDVLEKATAAHGNTAFWISKRWWRYRPKLPYIYFLQTLDSSEVAAVVFAEDLKKLYVIMKEGFPLEYIVDIPLDPYMFEIISNSGVEVDLIQKRQLHYILKLVFALLPGLLILFVIKQSVMVLYIASKRFLYKRYSQLCDMVYEENFVLPIGNFGQTKSMAKEVVLGGDVWDLLDEIMIYMNNPMQYYERGVKFVRGILLSGPPGTGKTLFARALSKASGLPFVFASGAEFTDSDKSGPARIYEIFSMARRNAPSFVFIDEIDAIAGKHAKKDPRRRATFEALIAQLDGEKEKTGVDRFSLSQAVIFICATNRPNDLDQEFVRSGRIDRRLYIGLPDARQRMQIFLLHSARKELAEDVDFEKLVFRTVGYSGADIRNLVNDAAIMSVRNGHPKICQQDIVDVLEKQLVEGIGVLVTEEEQRKSEERVSTQTKLLLAVHEAGHILLAHLFPQYDWHAFTQLLPGGKETALSVFYPRENMIDRGYTTFGYLKMQMIVAHGGRCAERIVFGDDITDKGRDDLKKITKIAREMVISPQNARLGLTPITRRVAIRDRPDDPYGKLIRYKWDDPSVIPVGMTPEVSEIFTRELTRYIEETEELALKGLRDNKQILNAITEKLLTDLRITGLEVEEVMKELSPIMFDDFVKPLEIDFEKEGPLPHNDKLRYRPLDIYPAPLHRC